MRKGRLKKTICYLSHSSGDWGGASRVLFTNLRLLNRDKYEPIVLLPSRGPILELLDSLGIRYEIWGGAHDPNGIIDYTKHLIKSTRFFWGNKVDLLHVNHAFWRPAEVLAAKLLRIPIVAHYHLVQESPGPFVRLASAIVAVSDFVAKKSGPGDVPKFVVHNAVELARFDRARDIRKELEIGQDSVVVSFIGQINSVKGIDLFIELANRVARDGVTFLIAGRCRDPEQFPGAYSHDQLLQMIGDNKYTKYIGYRSDIENIYHSSDIIVMPSRWEEPFGLINIEAGAAKRPIVSTKVGGIQEIVRDGENGYLVEKDDVASLANCVERLISNSRLRKQIGDTGRDIVEKEFTTRPVRDLEAVYEQLLA